MAASAAMGALSDRLLLTFVMMAAPADNAFQVAGLRRTPQAVQPDLRRKIYVKFHGKTNQKFSGVETKYNYALDKRTKSLFPKIGEICLRQRNIPAFYSMHRQN
jgi:hypothetical protein